MQREPHSTGVPQPAFLHARFHGALLVLIRATMRDHEALAERARAALRISSPGASLLHIDANPSQRRCAMHGNLVPAQLLEQPQLRTRLHVFPPHNALGHVALQLLAQGVPASALNCVPIRHQDPPGRPGDNELLLVMPNDTPNAQKKCLPEHAGRHDFRMRASSQGSYCSAPTVQLTQIAPLASGVRSFWPLPIRTSA